MQPDIFSSLLNYLPPLYMFDPWLTTAKFVFAFLDLVLLLLVVYLFTKIWKFRPHLVVSLPPEKKTLTLRRAIVQERWKKIAARASAGTLDSMRLAIIEADTLVNDSLKRMGLPGEHMADRLANFSDPEIDLTRIWRAHRLRNDLVHAAGFTISVEEAKKAIDDYESFLKNLHLL